MAKNAMPVSKAKTAYGLLSEIRKLIIEEPKRYDQWGWRRLLSQSDAFAPACGTVGCVGGWICVLKGYPFGDSDSTKFAYKILGMNGDVVWNELFDADLAGLRWEQRGNDSVVTMRAIRAHARRGAAHIARFQKKYAKQLKATKV